jgi:hypothetical protein
MGGKVLLALLADPARAREIVARAGAVDVYVVDSFPGAATQAPLDSVETVLGAQWSDAAVVLPGCDKNLPGTLMGLARIDRPSLLVYGGTIRAGCARLPGGGAARTQASGSSRSQSRPGWRSGSPPARRSRPRESAPRRPRSGGCRSGHARTA